MPTSQNICFGFLDCTVFVSALTAYGCESAEAADNCITALTYLVQDADNLRTLGVERVPKGTSYGPPFFLTEKLSELFIFSYNSQFVQLSS